jgi:hypothetical protein
LKLQYDEPLSNFAFNVNLRRYNEGNNWRNIAVVEPGQGLADIARHDKACHYSQETRFGNAVGDVASNVCQALTWGGTGFTSTTQQWIRMGAGSSLLTVI